VGTPTAGRRHTDLEKIIGMFVNTLVLRHYPSPSQPFPHFLAGVKERTLKAFENQDYPFENLVEKLVKKRDASRNPLFDVFFVLQSQVRDQAAAGNRGDYTGLEVLSAIPMEKTTSPFDLVLEAAELGERIRFSFQYCRKLFQAAAIRRMTGYFNAVLHAVTENPGIKISGIEIISAAEKKQVLWEFNDTARDWPAGKTLADLFTAQAEKTPHHVVLEGHSLTDNGNRVPVRPPSAHSDNRKREALQADPFDFGTRVSITYAELNQRSSLLAIFLQEKGIAPDRVAGILANPSLEMITGILGILKTGGAYLPLDPGYPAERILYMLADSNAKFLVTTAALPKEREKLRRWEGEKIPLDNEPFTPNRSAYPLPLLPSYRASSSNLAYVIYTSGSSGRPKGCLVEHRSVVNTLCCRREEYGLHPGVSTLQLFSCSFDGFVTDFFTPVLSGARVILADEEERKELKWIRTALVRHHITHLLCTPALFRAIITELTPREAAALSLVTLAGERFSTELLKISRSKNPRLEVSHEYGVTEATIMSTLYRHQQKDSRIKIGHPAANTAIFILDKQQPCPPGIPGEIVIGGAGVARGYLNNPELTAERFGGWQPGGRFLKKLPPWTPRKNSLLGYSCGDKVCGEQLSEPQDGPKGHYRPGVPPQKPPHGRHTTRVAGCLFGIYPKPYALGPRLYRTGDLGRWLPEGNIEFLGRRDNQVKIRGFRIELGEIENHLLRFPGITQALVLATGDEKGDRSLSAYLAADSTVDLSALRETLVRELPGYMIPAFFIPLERIPLTPNGKIDRNALPAPSPGTGPGIVPPRDRIEQTLAELWSELLGIDTGHISIEANFFELGGHSLKATVMVSRIYKTFDIQLTLRDIFNASTIKSIAALIKTLKGTGNETVIAREESEEIII
jgi:amino acid adenylation domain-containing protein